MQVAEHTGCPVTFAEGAGPDARDYRVDFAKINELLPAWQPRWTVPQGIDELAADMRQYGLTVGGLRGPALRAAGPHPRAHGGRSARRRAADDDDGSGPMSAPRCRLCRTELTATFVDLGMSPPCESYLEAGQLDRGETFYPLHVRICTECLLVQLPAYISGEEIFSHYAYFSSYSDSWVAHAKALRRRRRREARARSRLLRRRGREQRRLPAPARRRAGHPVPGHRAGRQRRRGRHREGRPHRGAVPRRGDGQQGPVDRTDRPTSSRRTTSSPTCPTSSTSPRACAPSSPTTAGSRSRSRTCCG